MSFIDWYLNNQNWLMIVCMFLMLGTILTIFYFLQKKGLDVFYTRKGIHISVSCYCFFWLMASDDSWIRWIAAIPPFVTAIGFLIIGFGLVPGDFLVKSMSRTGKPFDLVKGTFFYALVMSLICVFLWRDQPWGLITIMIIAFGDGFAAIVGKSFGRIKYRSLFGSEKTVEGSITMFLVSIIVSYLICLIFGAAYGENWLFGTIYSYLWLKIILLAAVGTIIEGLTPKDFDNLIIPIGVLLVSLAFGVTWLNPLT
jgi:dolichol kinase